MTSVRCSSLPLVSACAAASIPPAVRVDPARTPADLGTAIHEAMAAVVAGRDYDLEQICQRNNVELSDAQPMASWARARWHDTFAAMFPDASCEQPMRYADGDFELTGHADIVSVLPNEVRIADWKTGWLDTDPIEQLRGYAFLALMGLTELPEVDSVWVLKIDVRHQYAEPRRFHRAELLDWWSWMTTHMIDRDVYRPGDHCGRCPRAGECPAHRQELKRGLAVFADLADGSDARLEELVAKTPPVELAACVLAARQAEKFTGRFLSAVKAFVAHRGGSIGPLSIKEEPRQAIDVARGWELLSSTFDADTLHGLLSTSKTAVMDAIGETAPPRGKATAKRIFLARLEEAGAINHSSIQKLEVRSVNSHAAGEIAK